MEANAKHQLNSLFIKRGWLLPHKERKVTHARMARMAHPTCVLIIGSFAHGGGALGLFSSEPSSLLSATPLRTQQSLTTRCDNCHPRTRHTHLGPAASAPRNATRQQENPTCPSATPPPPCLALAKPGDGSELGII
jgi:hypothetical protein